MNAKFKELMEIASGGACYDDYPTNTLVGTEIELFARYIVNECADIITKYNYECIRNGVPYGISSDDIKAHFGLE